MATLQAEEVLKRYIEEYLPNFFGLDSIEINQQGLTGDRPLHVACWRGSLEKVEALLAGGANVNASGERDDTPLHAAVSNGCEAIVELLLAAKQEQLSPK